MSERTVAIIGLGLIGGSLARDLTARGVRVVGRDADCKTEQEALDEGVIAAGLGDDYARLSEAQWLVLAVPVGAVAAEVTAALPHLHSLRLITDVGSTKLELERTMTRLGLADRYVGSHPLAGDTRSGWGAARAELFAHARVYICPTDESRPAAVAAAHELWTLCGATTAQVTAAAHDRLLALTSHLPQLASTALALTLDAAGVPAAELGSGGRDMVRLAASSPLLWADIVRQNARNLVEALGAYCDTLEEMRAALEQDDAARMQRLFAEGKRWREQ